MCVDNYGVEVQTEVEQLRRKLAAAEQRAEKAEAALQDVSEYAFKQLPAYHENNIRAIADAALPTPEAQP